MQVGHAKCTQNPLQQIGARGQQPDLFWTACMHYKVKSHSLTSQASDAASIPCQHYASVGARIITDDASGVGHEVAVHHNDWGGG